MRRALGTGLVLLVAAASLVVPSAARPATGAVRPVTGAPVAQAGVLDRLASCVQARKRLIVLVLFDESSSVQETDPGDDRVRAADAALRELAELTKGRSDADGAVSVEVQLASFADDFTALGGWRPLGRDLTAIKADAALFADRDQGGSTDYAAGLTGATKALANRSAALTRGSAEPPCQALLWFTDGKYQPGNGDVAGGIQKLCGAGGIIERLRANGVALVSVALTTALKSTDQAFLRRLTGDGSNEQCGSATTPGGTYFSAKDVAGLTAAFVEFVAKLSGAPPQPCAPGLRAECTFLLEPGLRRFLIVVRVPGRAAEAALFPPTGQPVVRLARSGRAEAEAAGATLQWAWFGDKLAVVRGELSRSASRAWIGTWRMGVTEAGRPASATGSQVYLYSDLDVQVDGTPQFVRGQPRQFRARVALADGTPLGSDLRELGPRLTVTVADGADERPATVGDADAEGVHLVTFTAPERWRSAAVTVRLTVSLRAQNGVELGPPAVERSVPVVSTLAVSPTSLRFPSVVGDEPSQATLTVRASETGGCFWVDGNRVREDAGRRLLRLELDPPADSERTCVQVRPGGTARLTVALRAAEPVNGRLAGLLPLQIRVDGGDVEPIDIPVGVDVTQRRDAKSWLALVLLILVGLTPAGLLWLFSGLVLARFDPRNKLRAATVAATFWPGGAGELQPAGGGELAFRAADFGQVPYQPRQMRAGPVTIRAHPPRSPLGEPFAKVSASGRVCALVPLRRVARHRDRTTLDLHGTVVATVARPVTERADGAVEIEVVALLGRRHELTPALADLLREHAKDAARRLIHAVPD